MKEDISHRQLLSSFELLQYDDSDEFRSADLAVIVRLTAQAILAGHCDPMAIIRKFLPPFNEKSPSHVATTAPGNAYAEAEIVTSIDSQT